MKKQYTYRKEWEKIAEELGMQAKTHHVVATNQVTKNDYMLLVNNHKRFVRGMCALPLSEQKAKLSEFYGQMSELKAAQTSIKKEQEPLLSNLVVKTSEGETK